MHFPSTNGQDGEQKEVGDQGCRYKIDGKPQSHKRSELGISIIAVVGVEALLPRRYDSQSTERV